MITTEFLNKWKESNHTLEEKTVELVETLFKEKKDKANRPYIEHLYFVRDHFSSSIERMTALMHDILEDTKITPHDLEQLGYSSEIIEAVMLLTKPEEMSYEDYIDRLLNSNNDQAIKIKYVDLSHNMDISRISNPNEIDKKRIETKYVPARNKIKEYLEKKEGLK